jgi:hypothetical protein
MFVFFIPDQKAILDHSPKSSVSGRRQSRATTAAAAGKGVRFAPEPASNEPKPRVALVLLRYIFRHRVNRPMMLKKNRQQICDLRDVLKEYLPVIEKALGADDEHSTAADTHKLLCAWEVYLNLNVLLHDGGSHGGLGQDVPATFVVVEDLIEWVETKVIRAGAGVGRNGHLARGIARHLLRLCCNMVTMGLCDVNFVGHVVDLCGKVIPFGELF